MMFSLLLGKLLGCRLLWHKMQSMTTATQSEFGTIHFDKMSLEDSETEMEFVSLWYGEVGSVP